MGWLKQLETRGRRDEMMTNTQLYKKKTKGKMKLYTLYI